MDIFLSELIFERPTANHLKTRTQIKLLFAKKFDIMFQETELPLGAQTRLPSSSTGGRGSSISGGGGHIFIYSCCASLISFEIGCFYSL